MGRPVIDLTGNKYGRLTVVNRCENIGGKTAWLCQCDCGAEHKAAGAHLKDGNIQSCGCMAVDNGSAINKKHGRNRTPTHRSWVQMRQRCDNPKHHQYSRYGGRGVSVCERWNAFENFIADMGERPEGHTLDRIDVNGNYEPGNCRWAGPQQQANNRRNNVLLTVNGITRTLSEWAHATSQPAGRLKARKRSGWSDSEIVYGKTKKGVVA